MSKAENGERALQLCASSPIRPDVIIMDEHMELSGGKLYGHEVVAKIREQESFNSCVIIGCSSSADSVREKFIRAGCDDVWQKPLPPRNEASVLINKILQQKRNAISKGACINALFGQDNPLSHFTFSNPNISISCGGSDTAVLNQIQKKS